MYTTYGDDHRTPCSKYSIDTINDVALQFNAIKFVRGISEVKPVIETELKKVLKAKCYYNVFSLQITEVKLPQRYQSALEATNVAIQESLTVKQEEANTVIEMSTKKQQAEETAPIVINNAKATVTAKIATNKAKMEAFAAVIASESTAYASMKSALGFSTDASLLKFIKVQTVSAYNQKSLMVGISDL